MHEEIPPVLLCGSPPFLVFFPLFIFFGRGPVIGWLVGWLVCILGDLIPGCL